MSASHSPPPGSVPSGMSPDMQSTLAQMTGGAGQTNPAGAGSPPPLSSLGDATGAQKKPPRPVGSIPQEGKYLAEDVAQGLLAALPDFMQQLLGINPSDTPEDTAKKKQMLQRYNQMTADEQQYVQKKVQEEQQKKKAEEEEKAKKEQEAKQEEQDELPIPQGKQSGEGMPGMSNKKRTLTKLQSDRQKLSSAG